MWAGSILGGWGYTMANIHNLQQYYNSIVNERKWSGCLNYIKVNKLIKSVFRLNNFLVNFRKNMIKNKEKSTSVQIKKAKLH